MRKHEMYKVLQKGSLMVEALALLGLISMVTPVMYKKASERTTELQDINVATQMRTLNEALNSYVRNNFNKLSERFVIIDEGTGEVAGISPGEILAAEGEADYEEILNTNGDIEYISCDSMYIKLTIEASLVNW